VPDDRQRAALLAGLLLVATIIAYLPAFSGEFLWDDLPAIPQNDLMRSADGLWKIWTDPAANPVTEQHHPLVHSTFWVEYRVWGDHPLGYHVVNVLLHVANALMCWVLLRRLAVPGAWLAAGLFALHPVHVESTAWIIERKDLMSALFCLLAAWVYLNWIERETRWRYGLALGLFACAMLSKTMVIGFPLMLGLILWWKERIRTWRDVLPLLPFVAVGIAAFLLSYELLIHPRTEEVRPLYLAGVDLTFVDRLLIAGRALVFYIGKLVWPARLSAVYEVWEIDAGSLRQWAFPLLVGTTLVGLWAARRRLGRGPLAAALCYCIALGPALGFFTFYLMPYSYVADRFQYLASLAPIACVAALATRFGIESARRVRLVGIVVLLGLGLLTFQHARVFRNMGALFNHALDQGYESTALHFWLASYYERNAEAELAMEHHRRVIEIDPTYYRSYIQLGTYLLSVQRVDEAIPLLQESIRLEPRDPYARNNLAVALASRDRLGEAIAVLQENLELHPDDRNTQLNLAYYLLRDRQVEPSIEQFEELLRRYPETSRADEGLAIALRARELLESSP
jgi:tetratricopeptide (TPR) repeat protein